MRVLVCGGRDWTRADVIRARLQQLTRSSTIVHGHQRGADRIAAQVALRLGWSHDQIEAHPAEWDRYGVAAGPIRNEQMLRTGIDLVIAFHDDFEHSKGTRDMVERARKAGVPVELITTTGRRVVYPTQQRFSFS